MRIHEILNEDMSLNDATKIFSRFGVDAMSLSANDLKLAWRSLMLKHHPDRGGSAQLAQMINAAYDVLKNAVGSYKPRTGSPHTEPPPHSAGTPPWAWAGYSGGMAPSANIYRQDYRDMNFIKKQMWEMSRQSKEEWTIWGYDGYFIRGVLTVYGSPNIFDEMAKAMITWQTKGGNPYSCRAVLVSRRNTRDMLIVYSDGKFYGDDPIEISHDSFNANPSNDRDFERRLPGVLDKLKTRGRHG